MPNHHRIAHFLSARDVAFLSIGALMGLWSAFAVYGKPEQQKFDQRPTRAVSIVEIRGDGTQEWFLNGCRHRDDGPAMVRPDGSKQWWKYGEFVRSTSPPSLDRWRKENPRVIEALAPSHIIPRSD